MPISFNFSGKSAVVTGGARGIGFCIAEEFLKAGAEVAVIDINPPPSATGKTANHATPAYFQGDIADKTVLEKFTATLKKPVDFLINNACISKKGILSECGYEDFEYVQKVGVTAPYYLTSLLRKEKKLAKNASIVNIASTRAFQSQEDTESYSAAKGGIVALTHALSVSLAGEARVNSIAPGWIAFEDVSKTDNMQHSVKRVGRTRDIADSVLFLCSENAGFITGQNLTIDGGMSKTMIYHNDYGWKLCSFQ